MARNGCTARNADNVDRVLVVLPVERVAAGHAAVSSLWGVVGLALLVAGFIAVGALILVAGFFYQRLALDSGR